MSDIVFAAPPRSGEDIEALTEAIRNAVGWADKDWFPIVPFAENCLPLMVENLTFDVVEGAVLGARMGAVDPFTREFMIREDVYEGAVAGHPRHRFTVGHETGHAVMHIGTLNRLSRVSGKLEAFRDPEWQANRFAAALLMPRKLVKTCKSITEVATRFGVSKECAVNRLKTLKIYIA